MAIKRINVSIDEKMVDWLKDRSEKTGMSVSSIVKMAIYEHKDKLEIMEQLSSGKMAEMVNTLSSLKDKLDQLDDEKR